MERRSFLESLMAVSLAGLAPILGVAGCSRAGPLTVGVHPWIGYESLYLAEEFGWLPEQVRLAHHAVAPELLAGLVDGSLDAATLTLDEVIRARLNGLPLVVALIMDVSAGADVLMVRPDIRSLSDLRGRRIAVEHSALGTVMFRKILERAGLGVDDVIRVDLSMTGHLEAWSTGTIDAAICFEPTSSRLEQAGAVRLFDSREIPDTIFDVLVVNRDRVDGREDQVTALIAAHFRGLEHLVRNPYDAIYRIASRQGVSTEVIRRSLAGVMLPDLSANQRYLGRDSRFARAITELQAVLALTSPDAASAGQAPGTLFSPDWLPRSSS